MCIDKWCFIIRNCMGISPGQKISDRVGRGWPYIGRGSTIKGGFPGKHAHLPINFDEWGSNPIWRLWRAIRIQER